MKVAEPGLGNFGQLTHAAVGAWRQRDESSDAGSARPGWRLTRPCPSTKAGGVWAPCGDLCVAQRAEDAPHSRDDEGEADSGAGGVHSVAKCDEDACTGAHIRTAHGGPGGRHQRTRSSGRPTLVPVHPFHRTSSHAHDGARTPILCCASGPKNARPYNTRRKPID